VCFDKLSLSLSLSLQIDGKYHIGDQLFENYGQPNHIYFLYHGFSLLSNSHDCVQHDFTLSPQERRVLEKQSQWGEANKRVLQNLRVTASGVFSACLSLPLTPQTWAFLTMKVSMSVGLCLIFYV
jgi:hypothetical protein